MKAIYERGGARIPFRIVCGQVHEHTDAPCPLTVLSTCRQLPRKRRTAKQDNELTPVHANSNRARHVQDSSSRANCSGPMLRCTRDCCVRIGTDDKLRSRKGGKSLP